MENQVIKSVAARNQTDVAKVILLYLIHKGYVVLPKSDHEERIASNIQLKGMQLSDENIRQIDSLGKTYSLKVCWDSKDVV